MSIKIFGHKNPDTDSVCGAIIAAWYYTEVLGRQAKPYRLGALNKETEYVLNKFKLKAPELLESVSEKDNIIIVDTNNADELFENINDTNLIGIIDHHKLFGNISTAGPIDIQIKPLASTASVLFEMGLSDFDLPKHIAQLICACIISDTLLFRSPTTTTTDREILAELAHEHDIDTEKLAEKMFEAKSNISHLSPDQIITYDSKKVNIGGKDILVGVLETTNPKSVFEQKEQIQEAMKAKVKSDNLHAVLFYAIDILNEESIAITYDEISKEIIESAFETTVKNEEAKLKNIVSRKKQIIPALEKA